MACTVPSAAVAVPEIGTEKPRLTTPWAWATEAGNRAEPPTLRRAQRWRRRDERVASLHGRILRESARRIIAAAHGVSARRSPRFGIDAADRRASGARVCIYDPRPSAMEQLVLHLTARHPTWMLEQICSRVTFRAEHERGVLRERSARDRTVAGDRRNGPADAGGAFADHGQRSELLSVTTGLHNPGRFGPDRAAIAARAGARKCSR